MTNTAPTRRRVLLGLSGSALALSGCVGFTPEAGRPLGSHLDEGHFGEPTRNNIGVHNGEIDWAHALGERFAREVPTTINFAFNSSDLDEEARAILRQQAAFIRHFPEVRFSVYGHTDAVGGSGFNQRLGRRRARAAVNYLVSQGVNRSRLEALVSFGETQLIVATEEQERRNRRTVTPRFPALSGPLRWFWTVGMPRSSTATTEAVAQAVARPNKPRKQRRKRKRAAFRRVFHL